MAEDTKALQVVETGPSEIVEANPDAVVAAFKNYQEIQGALDKALGPNSIMKIQGKPFRKKVYWRAIATAFNLQLDLMDERREVFTSTTNAGDWGYCVTYRATAGNGRHCDGDGSCFASEKPVSQATVHNVRAHAHTRAKNRAIADLVGFGEVSAEEMQYTPSGQDKQGSSKPAASGQGPMANEKQRKLLMAKCYARAKMLTGEDDQHELAGSIGKTAKGSLGITGKEFSANFVDGIIAAIDTVNIDKDNTTYIEVSPEEF